MEITGTDGDDVIVANGVTFVSAGKGDDTICVNYVEGDSDSPIVRDGAGDDYLLVEDGATVYAGMSRGGKDTVIGNAGKDQIDVNRGSAGDVYDLGGGADYIYGDLGGATVRLGPGDDQALPTIGAATRPPLALNGGSGRNTLALQLPPRGGSRSDQLVVNNLQQHAKIDGTTRVTWSSFEDFPLGNFQLTRSQVFLGGPADESVSFSHTTARADMGDGDDSIDLDPSVDVPGTLKGGPGHDLIRARISPGDTGPDGTQEITVDLVGQTVRFTRRTDVVTRIDSFADTDLYARKVTITGDGNANALTGASCDTTIDAGAKNDTITLLEGPVADHEPICSTQTSRVNGNDGDDVLLGSPGDDILIGGPGTDTAVGGAGTDRCRAETTSECETP